MLTTASAPGSCGQTADTSISGARCVLFAYHEMGYACLSELLALGAPIAALFTHADNPTEEVWWRPCSQLARQRGIEVFTTETFDEVWQARIAAMHPSI